MTLTQLFTAIANSIRTKKGTQSTITAENFPNEIASIQTGTDTSDANATANDILRSKTAYVNGTKLTGTMPNNGVLSYTPSDNLQTIPIGYTAGGTIAAVDITTLSDYQRCYNIADEILNGSRPYIELKYIESTGTQYINTMVYGSNNTGIEIKFNQLTNNLYAGILGGRKSWRESGFTYLNSDYYNGRPDTSHKLFQLNNNQASFATLHTYYQCDTLVTIRDGILTITDYTNTETFTHPSREEEFTALYPITLFCVNQSGTPLLDPSAYAYKLRLYYCKIYNNSNVLVRDFIPVQRKSDNVICLYDKVSEQYFTNAGTGAFIAGPEIGEE